MNNNMFNKLRNNIGAVILIAILGLVLMGATYVNLGPTSNIDGDIGVTAGHGYYIDNVLLTYSDVDAQQADAALTSISGLTYVEDSLIKFTANDTYTVRTLTEVKTDLSLNNVTNDAQIAKSIGTAQGDLIYFTGSATPTVLPKGTASQVLTMNAGATAPEWAAGGTGYTNLTSFVDQTAWRVFYSNTDGDVVELALGTDGQYLKSTGATSAPIFDTPGGAGDMLKATYDSDEDGDIDVAAGGTEKSAWTQYAIPYLSNTTVFGEIPIGTAEYALTVAAGATGYDWTLFDLSLYYLKTEIDEQSEIETIWGDALMNDLIDDTTPELGGNLDIKEFYILISDDLGDDHDYSGLVDSVTVGENVVFGQILYHKFADDEWYLALADAYATAHGEGIALESKGDGQECLVLRMGYIRDDSAFDFGANAVFLNDDTGGACDDTAPAESGDQIQVVGTAMTADIMYFNPSQDIGEI